MYYSKTHSDAFLRLSLHVGYGSRYLSRGELQGLAQSLAERVALRKLAGTPKVRPRRAGAPKFNTRLPDGLELADFPVGLNCAACVSILRMRCNTGSRCFVLGELHTIPVSKLIDPLPEPHACRPILNTHSILMLQYFKVSA